MPEMIELPLDPEYITSDGWYMAGYLWGQHVRSERDARQAFPGDTSLHEEFYKGVNDGYHDSLNKQTAEIEAAREYAKKVEEEEEIVKVIANAGNLYRDAGLSLEEYRSLLSDLTKYYDTAIYDPIKQNQYDSIKYDDIPF